jgi:hypothetical protein
VGTRADRTRSTGTRTTSIGTGQLDRLPLKLDRMQFVTAKLDRTRPNQRVWVVHPSDNRVTNCQVIFTVLPLTASAGW